MYVFLNWLMRPSFVKFLWLENGSESGWGHLNPRGHCMYLDSFKKLCEWELDFELKKEYQYFTSISHKLDVTQHLRHSDISIYYDLQCIYFCNVKICGLIIIGSQQLEYFVFVIVFLTFSFARWRMQTKAMDTDKFFAMFLESFPGNWA